MSFFAQESPPANMYRKVGFFLLWLGFIAYAFIFAPPDQPDTLDLIKNLSTGRFAGINPLIISLFNLMGIWPLIYGCIILIDGRGQKFPAWLFSIASFGVGAFAILPYLAARQANPEFTGSKNILIKILDTRFTGVILTIAAILLFGYGIVKGDWSDFLQQWQTSRFIHVMSLDFCMLSVIFPALLEDDMTRRNMDNRGLFWAIALLPLFGPLLYLCIRKPLMEITSDRLVEEVKNLPSAG